MDSNSIRLLFLNILTAVGIGVWIPLRLVFFHQAFSVDVAIEVSIFALFLLNYTPRFLKVFDKQSLQPLADDPGLWIFLMDLCGSFPLVGLTYPLWGQYAIYFFIFKLALLRHLFSVRNLIDAFDTLHPIAARLIPLGLIVPIIVHLVSCGWVFLGSGTIGLSGDRRLDYIRGVYWAVTTLATVGYGDITPKTPIQMAYTCMTMIAGVGFFGFVLSNVASLLARIDAAREEHLSILDRVEAFMRYNEVPLELRRKVRSYYRYLWDSRKGYDNTEILNRLPKGLKSEVSLYLNKDVIEKVPLLRGAESELLLDIVMKLKPLTLVPHEKIFHAGEPGDAMYFIQNGSVDVIAPDGHHLATLQEGSFFGETALLTSQPRNASVKAATYCDLFVLRRDSFETVLGRYPVFEKTVRAVAHERLQQNAS